jgi:hypothetical protein
MNPSRKQKVIAGTIAGLAVAGGGAAIGATQFASPSARSAAIVTDAAQQLGVQPSALSDALKKAEKNQVDAAVTAGELTKEQGDAIKAAIDSGKAPLLGGGFGLGHDGPGFGFGHHDGGPGGSAHLDAAATFLGVTAAELRTDLEAGKTLADIAKAKGKAVADLVDALVADEKKELDAAVAAGQITAAQEKTIEADLQQRTTDLVNGKRPAGPDGEHGFRRFGGPRGGWAPAPAFRGANA